MNTADLPPLIPEFVYDRCCIRRQLNLCRIRQTTGFTPEDRLNILLTDLFIIGEEPLCQLFELCPVTGNPDLFKKANDEGIFGSLCDHILQQLFRFFTQAFQSGIADKFMDRSIRHSCKKISAEAVFLLRHLRSCFIVIPRQDEERDHGQFRGICGGKIVYPDGMKDHIPIHGIAVMSVRSPVRRFTMDLHIAGKDLTINLDFGIQEIGTCIMIPCTS